MPERIRLRSTVLRIGGYGDQRRDIAASSPAMQPPTLSAPAPVVPRENPGAIYPDMLQGGIPSEKLALSGTARTSMGGSSATTADTTAWHTVFTITVVYGTSQARGMFPFQVHAKHSANNANFGIALYFYNDPTGLTSGSFQTAFQADNLFLPTLGQWDVVSGTGEFALDSLSPGKHSLSVMMRNYTTGTLTTIQPSIDWISAVIFGY